jgi:colanic acid/amylovoran biosynthesis glycosyltransferase
MEEKNRPVVAIYSGDIPSTTFIERLITGLADEGYEVVLFGKYRSRVRYAQQSIVLMGNASGLNVVVQFFMRLVLVCIRYPSRFKALKKHLGFGPLSGRKEFVVWQKYLPVLLRLPDIFHVQWAKAAEEWVFLKQLFGVKLVLSLRGTHINVSPLADAMLAESYRKSFPLFNAFHGVSHAIVKEAIQYGMDGQRAQVIYSGLLPRSYPQRQHVSNVFSILAVGRFHWKKGYHYLLDALLTLKAKGVSFTLTLIAQGRIPEELVYQVHDLDLHEQVNWINGLTISEVETQMLKHDVLVLPSVEEGIANVVLEAMQAGLPVISTTCGGMAEVIEDGVNGFLVPVRNPQALADAIQTVQLLSPDKRKALVQQAHQTITERFNLKRNVKQFSSLYEHVWSCE